MGVRKRRRRAARPRLEPVEARQLPSGLIASMSAASPPLPSFQKLSRRVESASTAAATGTPIYSGNTGNAGNGLGLSNNPASPLLGNGQPTPRELARETFHAYFSGRYYTSPGRFSDQGTTYFFRGLGGSTDYLHGDFDMGIVTPLDPNAPFQGEAMLEDKNTNSQAIQGFILSGSRTDVDGRGRPTHLTFTADPNIYSGAFFVEAAQGSVDITYGPRNSIAVRFSGLVYTSGLTSPLVNQDLYSRGGRPLTNRA
jgi:hypothetical protein